MNAFELAEKYGNEMRLHGKSLCWSSPRKCPDTTESLKRSPDFLVLNEELKKQILEYGNLCKCYGMGEYQEEGPNAELYYKHYGNGGIPNPFPNINVKQDKAKESEIVTEKTRKAMFNLAEKYGNEMRLHGKSLYWNSPRECPDTTESLKRNPDFLILNEELQKQILEYGHLCKRCGMGEYQQRGPNVELYDKYSDQGGVPNPFRKESNLLEIEMEKIAFNLAKRYGNEMFKSGENNASNITGEIIKNSQFLALSTEAKKKILEYGVLCEKYGRGSYEAEGPNTELYFKYFIKGGVPNPFLKKDEKNEKPKTSSENMRDMAFKFADEYGKVMEHYGKNIRWTTKPDPTASLLDSPKFNDFDDDTKIKILEYGRLCKYYGVGFDKSEGVARDIYSRYYNNGGVPNPFAEKESEKSSDPKYKKLDKQKNPEYGDE